MKILITGGSGLLGSNLIKILEKDHQVFSPSSRDLNIINSILVTKYIDDIKPDVVVHCAAIAKFAIAENKPIDTIDTNVIGTCNIVKACVARNIRMIYISTSHVFDGKKGNYSIDDSINPLTKYSKSKAAGEMVTSIHPNSLIIRTEFCEEIFPFETAYVDKFSSKEYIDVLAPMVAKKCISDQIGISHVGGPRRSFYEFGKLRNPNVKEGTVKDLISTSTIPILIDTSLISD